MAKRKSFEEKKQEFIKAHLENEKWSFTEEWFKGLKDDDFMMLIESNLSGLKYNSNRVAKKYISMRSVKKNAEQKSDRKRGEIVYSPDQIKFINTVIKSKHPEKIKVRTSHGVFSIANKGVSFNAFDSEGKKVKVAGAKILELIED